MIDHIETCSRLALADIMETQTIPKSEKTLLLSLLCVWIYVPIGLFFIIRFFTDQHRWRVRSSKINLTWVVSLFLDTMYVKLLKPHHTSITIPHLIISHQCTCLKLVSYFTIWLQNVSLLLPGSPYNKLLAETMKLIVLTTCGQLLSVTLWLMVMLRNALIFLCEKFINQAVCKVTEPL